MNNIFLLPYGGGGAASYRSYADRFPPAVGRIVAVEIPGRGTRAGEPYATSMRECAARALEAIDTHGGEYVVHGHCMGALLAFEAIRLIEARKQPLPLFMVASGRNAPGHVSDWLRRLPEMDDRSLFNELQELGGIPRGLSFAMARHFLTTLRHDQAMLRDYDPGGGRIPVPILALAGNADTMTNPDAVAEWADYTSRFLSVEWLEGRHYFPLEAPDRVAARIEAFARVVQTLTAA